MHETHASWVFVAGERAYKIKKPLALGFLDYSTLALRHSACREEVRVNQELAPGLYLGVRAIVRSQDGFHIVAEAAPDAVEYVVEMRRFSEDDTFAGLIAAGSLTRAHVTAAARRLAAFHRSRGGGGGVGTRIGCSRCGERNVEELRHVGASGRVAPGCGCRLRRGLCERARARVSPAGAGWASPATVTGTCVASTCWPGHTVRVVDRIEFDPELRRSDIACDLAFLAMDLEASGQRWAARELVGAYRDAGMDPGDETLRSFYAAHWALVRAKVTLIAAAEHDGPARVEQLRCAQQLWLLGERLCWRARAPLAVVVCGPAASGKSVLAGELSRRSQMPVVSSDAVRKRLAHLAPSQPARREHYSAGFTRATYEQLTRRRASRAPASGRA